MGNIDVDGSVVQTVHKTRTREVSACYTRQRKGHMNFNNIKAASSDICNDLNFRKYAACLNK